MNGFRIPARHRAAYKGMNYVGLSVTTGRAWMDGPARHRAAYGGWGEWANGREGREIPVLRRTEIGTFLTM